MDLSIKKYSTQRVLRSAALVLLLFGISKIIQQVNGLIFSIILLFISAALFGPIALGIAKIQYRRYIIFRKGGFLKSLKGIRLRLPIAGILSIISAIYLAQTLVEFSNLAWLIIVVSLVLVEWLHCNVGRFSQRQYEYPFSVLCRVTLFKWVLSAILAVILVFFYCLGFEIFTSSTKVSSNLFQETLSIMELGTALSKYLADSLLFKTKNIFLIIFGVSIYLIKVILGLYLLLSFLDWVYVPIKEYKKIFMPIKDFAGKNVVAEIYISRTDRNFLFMGTIVWLSITAILEYSLNAHPITNKLIPIKNVFFNAIDAIINGPSIFQKVMTWLAFWS